MIAVFVKIRGMIHAVGSFFQHLDDETLFLFFRAYLTPPHATFIEHHEILRHGYLALVLRSPSEPDFEISCEIASGLDKLDAGKLREVLFKFRAIEFCANMEGFLCIIFRFYNAAAMHRVADVSKSLRKQFLQTPFRCG